MRNLICFVFLLLNVNLFAQIDFKITDFKILPLDCFLDKNNEYHAFDDLFTANYGIFAKLIISSKNNDTLLTSKDNIQLIEVGSEKILFHHWGNDIILFSDINVNDSIQPMIYTKPMISDSVFVFMYGGFTNMLYDIVRKKFKCDDCNEVVLRNPKIIERLIRKKSRLRILYGERKMIDVKCGKVCLIAESGIRIYYLSLWKSMIKYQNFFND